MPEKFQLGAVCTLCVVSVFLLALLHDKLEELYQHSGTLTDIEYSWLFRLLLNLCGYAVIMVPGFIMYKYLQKINYFDKIINRPPTVLSRILYACYGPYERLGEAGREAGAGRGAELVFCALGLMASYLVWGLMQEKIMTQEYVLSDGRAVRFGDAGVLVGCNRVGGMLAALGVLLARGRPLLAAPLGQLALCAATNVLSAWCQYEALKYVAFPTQVLSKSCKVIPVMLMGKLISRSQYAPYEYVTAAAISLGMALFMLGTPHQQDDTAGTSSAVAGSVLLSLYLCCDAFTSAWQGALFRRYALHPLQMLFAASLCGAALAGVQTRWPRPPLAPHPAFLADLALLAASSALGQLLIYRTIAGFGPVVFAIIMTLRQAVSILLSCAVYGHAVSAPGALGVTLVFAAVLARLHCARARARARALPKQ